MQRLLTIATVTIVALLALTFFFDMAGLCTHHALVFELQPASVAIANSSLWGIWTLPGTSSSMPPRCLPRRKAAQCFTRVEPAEPAATNEPTQLR
jgi:hypothetical protein